ncbi:MAG TPA: HPP family protein [Rhodocyclaceae bacterium]|nr:HPP family protein [Rhodocyclaceae bacterium]
MADPCQVSVMRIGSILAYVFPEQTPLSVRERIVSALAAFVSLALVAWLSSLFVLEGHRPLVVASMGASAMLLFGLTHSPLSQPWAFVGGHLIAAVVGVACAQQIPYPEIAIALSVAITMLATFSLRCVHPPAGATAVTAVVGGYEIQSMGFGYVSSLVGLNVLFLLLVALAVNTLLPGRRYPAAHLRPETVADDGTETPDRPEHEDIMAALRSLDTFIDVSEEDLENIYALASLNRQKRRLGSIVCRDIMTRNVASVVAATSMAHTWEVLRKRGIRGVPVLDAARRVVGVVAISDFLKSTDWDWNRRGRLRCFLASARKGPMRAGDIMSTPAITLCEEAHVTELFALFSDNGINHVPIVDAAGKLAGIVTRLDLLNLFRGDRILATETLGAV